MPSKKKCPQCGEWSVWNENPNDTCEHCGSVLDLKSVKRMEIRAEAKALSKEKWIFAIKDSDNGFMRFLKQVGNTTYMVFMVILSFIMGLIAALPA
ncbi:MAG: hypothetical protein ACFCUU_12620 [Cyclobacteriaceae bacterium]